MSLFTLRFFFYELFQIYATLICLVLFGGNFGWSVFKPFFFWPFSIYLHNKWKAETPDSSSPPRRPRWAQPHRKCSTGTGLGCQGASSGRWAVPHWPNAARRCCSSGGRSKRRRSLCWRLPRCSQSSPSPGPWNSPDRERVKGSQSYTLCFSWEWFQPFNLAVFPGLIPGARTGHQEVISLCRAPG